jgi:hypothetical protein
MHMDQECGPQMASRVSEGQLAMLSSPDLPKHLDLVTDNFAKTQEYLAKNECPAAAGAASLALPTAGCKAFTWNNQ